MLGILKSAITFLDAMSKGKNQERMANMIAKQKKHVMTSMGRVAFSQDEATECLNMLNDPEEWPMQFTDDDKEEIESCIHNITEQHVSGASSAQQSQASMKQKGQTMQFMYNYLTETDWIKITDPNATEDFLFCLFCVS